MMYQVIYIPKIEDEIVVAEYDSMEQANAHMDTIKCSSMKAHKQHYIKWRGEN